MKAAAPAGTVVGIGGLIVAAVGQEQGRSSRCTCGGGLDDQNRRQRRGSRWRRSPILRQSHRGAASERPASAPAAVKDAGGLPQHEGGQCEGCR